MTLDRFAALNLAELQQLLAAVQHAQAEHLIAHGHGNLLPRLGSELTVALEQALDEQQQSP